MARFCSRSGFHDPVPQLFATLEAADPPWLPVYPHVASMGTAVEVMP